MHDIESPVPGRVEDRPWGATLASLRTGGRRGQLTLRSAGGNVHKIAFVHGVVVGATSPLASDTVARIALSSRLVTAAQVAAFARGRGRSHDDDLDAFVDAMGLTTEQVHQLKHRVLVQRAARTFAIERGDFVLEDRISIPVMIGIEVDLRAVVYQGARLVLDGERLAADLRQFGTRFVLTAAAADVARFGFTEVERRVLAALCDGTSAAELEALQRDLDPRMVQAVIYALAACGAVARVAAPAPPIERTPTHARTPTEQSACVPMLIRRDPVVSRPVVSREPRPSTEPPAPVALGRGTRRWTEPFLDVRPTAVRPNALTARELRGLIAAGSANLEQGVDHFTMLGLPIGASVEAVRTAYIELARNLRPERLAELRVRDQGFHARALLAQICIAYTVLTEPARRAEYIAALRGSGIRAAMIDFGKLAAEAFQRGERALRADEPELAVAELRTACELAPDDVEYLAMLGRAELGVTALKRR